MSVSVLFVGSTPPLQERTTLELTLGEQRAVLSVTPSVSCVEANWGRSELGDKYVYFSDCDERSVLEGRVGQVAKKKAVSTLTAKAVSFRLPLEKLCKGIDTQVRVNVQVADESDLQEENCLQSIVFEVCCFDFGVDVAEQLPQGEEDLEGLLFSQAVLDCDVLEIRHMSWDQRSDFCINVTHAGDRNPQFVSRLYKAAPSVKFSNEDCTLYYYDDDSFMKVAMLTKKNELLCSCSVFLRDLKRYVVARLQQPAFWKLMCSDDGFSCWIRMRAQISLENDPTAMLARYGHPVRCLPFRINHGDLILENVKHTASAALIHTMTGSRWDHIGIVVPIGTRNSLYILEASTSGVYAFPFEDRLKATLGNGVVVGLRRLQMERTEEFLPVLKAFVEEHEGKSYDSVSTLIRGRFRLNQTEDWSTFFCSELVAAALKRVKVLDDSRVSSNYLPKDFEAGDPVGLIPFRAELLPLKEFVPYREPPSPRRSRHRRHPSSTSAPPADTVMKGKRGNFNNCKLSCSHNFSLVGILSPRFRLSLPAENQAGAGRRRFSTGSKRTEEEVQVLRI
jgi:hypothetical protein